MIGCIYKHPPANVEEFTLVSDEFLNKLNPSKYDMYIYWTFEVSFTPANREIP